MTAKKQEQELGKYSLEKMIMDYDSDKYDLVVLASLHAKHIHKREEFRHEPSAKVLKASLDDILSGRVTEKEIIEVCRAEFKEEVASAAAEEEKKAARKPANMEVKEVLN